MCNALGKLKMFSSTKAEDFTMGRQQNKLSFEVCYGCPIWHCAQYSVWPNLMKQFFMYCSIYINVHCVQAGNCICMMYKQNFSYSKSVYNDFKIIKCVIK